jgi:hypothetical protein
MAGYGYRAQLPNSVVQRFVPRNNGAVGEAVAEGLGRLAGAVGQGAERIDAAQQDVEERERRRAQSKALLAAGGAVGDAERELADKLPALQNAPERGIDAKGYAKAVYDLAEQQNEAILAGIEDEEVRDRIMPSLRDRANHAYVQASDYERRVSAKAESENLSKAKQAGLNGIVSNPNAATIESFLAAQKALIDGTDHPQALKDLYLTQARDEALLTAMQSRFARRDFDAVEQMLDQGALDTVLTPQEKIRWQERIADGRADVEREAKAAAEANATSALETLQVLDARDEEQPATPAEWDAALRAYQRAGGDPSTLTDYQVKARKSTRRQAVRDLKPVQLQVEIRQLQEKVAAGKGTPADDLALAAMKEETERREIKEADTLTPLVKGTDADRVVAADRLAAERDPEKRWRLATKAGSPRMGVIGNIASRPVRARAVEGMSLRRARKEDWLPPAVAGKTGREDRVRTAKRLFEQVIGEDLKRQIGGQYDAVFETAMDIMAASQNAAGSDDWSFPSFRSAVQAAFGATDIPGRGRRGGLGEVRGRIVALPSRWTAGQVDFALARADYGRARYANGAKAATADVLRNYRLIQESEDASGTRYRFEDSAGRPLLRDDGDFFRVRLPADPGR